MTRFPTFKRLELGDHEAITSFTSRYPAYSDFEFASLYAWSDEVLWSVYKDTLVVRFADYSTGRPFFSFLDDGRMARELAPKLLSLADECGYGEALELVPEAAALALGAEFAVAECEDHADYLYDLEAHSRMEGKEFHKLRQAARRFEAACPEARTLLLDLDDYDTRRAAHWLWGTWARKRGCDIPNETRAFERFLGAHREFDVCAVGLVSGQCLVGMDITVLTAAGWGNSLFQKADLDYPGITGYLAREAARMLLARGCRIMNAQQDLGLPSLRESKRRHRPCGFLRKYRVSFADADTTRTEMRELSL